MKNKFILALLTVMTLLFLVGTARAQVSSPRITSLCTNTVVPNNGSTNLNLNTTVSIGAPFADYLTLYANTVCTNIPVNGNTTLTWKFAYDAPQGTNATGTNFINPGTLVYPNTSTTNAPAMTNIPAILWRGCTGFQLTSLATTGQTNGGNGSLIGQSTSVFLNQSK